jgi:hypothetical protein
MATHKAASLRRVSISKDDRARELRGALLEAASRRQTVTYGELMKRFGLSRGRTFSEILGHVDQAEGRLGLPGFAAIVVRKDTRYPGGGYFCDDSLPFALRRPDDRRTDPKLSGKEVKHVRAQQERIWLAYAHRR